MIRRLSALAVIPFFLAACEPREEDPFVDDVDVAEERAHEIGDTETLNISEVENSGVSGDVRFTVLGEYETDVVVEVHDARPNASYQAAIYEGTCDNLGEERYPLETVETDAEGHGAGTMTLNVRLANVMDGNHVVALHGPRADDDVDTDEDYDETDMDAERADLPVACGEISEHGAGLGW